MKPISRKNIFLLFWTIVLFGLIGVIFDIRVLDIIFKPLLIPALIAAVLLLTKETKGRLKILAALFFSFLGDVFLLMEEKNAVFFIAGLSCFLLTHIFYIAYFIQVKKSGASLVKKHPYLIGAILIYSASLCYLLWHQLGDLRVPVIAYACVISIMLYCSLALPYSVSKIVRQLFIAGALFFVLSDSLLAINKFYRSFPAGAFLVRLTYCIAQYFLVRGFIKKRY